MVNIIKINELSYSVKWLQWLTVKWFIKEEDIKKNITYLVKKIVFYLPKN